MLTTILLTGFLALSYGFLMLLYRRGWKRQPVFHASRTTPRTCISVIIPARNEAANIGACIDSLLAQDYPRELLEVIVVDDHSDDGTAAVVERYAAPGLHCLRLADHLQPGETVRAFKKKALSVGIAHSSGTLIVTTDADCSADTGWLHTIAAAYEAQQPVMLVAPVDFTCKGNVVELLQSIDFMSMQGITAAAHALRLGNMSNGANLAFERRAFDAVGGYSGIDHLASGDDYLLMLKMQEHYPGRIAYVKSPEAIVRTAPQPDWRGFFQQRIRWASKSGKYKDHRLTAILVLVYVYNFSFLVLLVCGLLHPALYGVLLASLLLKTGTELCYLFPVTRFFGKERQLRYFLFLQPLHVAYIILAGFLGMIGTYQWKDRKLR